MEEPASPSDWHDLTLSIEQVVRFGLRRLPALSILSLLPILILHGFPDLSWPESIGSAALKGLLWTILAVAVYGVSALLHEGIHILAMLLFAGAPLSSIRFGFRPREGVVYVHSSRPMSARAYRGVLLLPAFVQGILPIVYGSVVGSGWLVIYGYVMLVSSIGDLAILQLIRHLHVDDLVRDHPYGVGCQVLVRDTQPPAW